MVQGADAGARAVPPALKTFGTGWSASIFNETEQTILEHAVPSGTVGVMTHFWITGMEQTVHRPGPFFSSNGTDNVTVRYYIDGEQEPSIEFRPPMAAGVGFSDANADGDPTGMAHRLIGRAGMGGWYLLPACHCHCLCLCLCLCLNLCLCLCVPVSLSLCVSVPLSLCDSVSVSLSLCLSVSVCVNDIVLRWTGQVHQFEDSVWGVRPRDHCQEWTSWAIWMAPGPLVRHCARL